MFLCFVLLWLWLVAVHVLLYWWICECFAFVILSCTALSSLGNHKIWNTPQVCAGMHHQWGSWGHQGFRVFQHQTLSPRWPIRGWSGRRLRPSRSKPRAHPLHPKPPSGFLCSFIVGMYGPPLCSSSYTKPCPAAHQHGFYTAPPASGILLAAHLLDGAWDDEVWM